MIYSDYWYQKRLKSTLYIKAVSRSLQVHYCNKNPTPTRTPMQYESEKNSLSGRVRDPPHPSLARTAVRYRFGVLAHRSLSSQHMLPTYNRNVTRKPRKYKGTRERMAM